ncbi:MAG: DUF5686 and carboxypeptidase regulatory-like domain-containing protein [Flavobacteriales bacterium]|nr:DUF5686 and carboxypeptidase regulatory-like domain-containing protein [Flavobacteriales bacterium]
MSKTLTILSFLISFSSFSQKIIRGKLTDRKSNESLPFVHIISKKAQAVSDIEGNYVLKVPENSEADSVKFSLIGYEKYKVTIEDLQHHPNFRMSRSSTSLSEVTIVAEEDPAYAMIRRAVKRRKFNDPEKLNKFRYSSYNKAVLDVPRTDSIQAELDSTNFAKAHFMMMESATRVTFEQPNKLKEEVIGNQITGFSNPLFALQSNSFQPFSCYSPYLTFIDFDFLNPISPGSDGRYIFQLEDSIETAEGKSYIISFQPSKNANGNLLEGLLTLDADEWAIVHIQAKNTGKHNLARFEIRQQYGKSFGNWFPEQSSSIYEIEDPEVPLLIISNTYIDSVEFDFDPGKFNIANIEVPEEANQRSKDEWKHLRLTDLNEMEENSYKVWDTLDTRILNAMDWTMAQSASLARGRLTLGKMDILLPRLFGFNQYEGFRLGIGLATSEKLVKWVSAEGYFAYGFRDREIKYGGGLRFNIQPRRSLQLYLGYENDVDEPGRSVTDDMGGFMQLGEIERDLFTRFMNPYEAYIVELTYRPMRNVKTTLRYKNEHRTFESTSRDDVSFTGYDLTTTEAGILIECNPGEKLTAVGRALIPQGISYPRFSVELSQAFNGILDGEQEFTKAEVRMMHEIKIPKLGPFQMYAVGGKIWADEINQSNLFLGKGIQGERDLGIIGFGYFHSMPIYSFINDRYLQVGVSQNFGNPFGLEAKFSRPEIRLMYQAAIGNINIPYRTISDLPNSSMDRAYLEGGVILDNLLRLNGNSFYYSGLGIGVFYRHGHYELPAFKDNLAYAVSFVLSF